MYVFGPLDFSSGIIVTSQTTEVAANYAEHALMLNKPRLQRMGTELEILTMDIMLHYSRVDVNAVITQIREIIEKAETHSLVCLTGQVLGRFVLKSASTNSRMNGPNGTLMSAELSLSFLESLNPGDEIIKTSDTYALASSFKGELFKAIEVPYAPAAETTQLVAAVNSETVVVDSIITQVEANPQQAGVKLKQADKKLTSIRGQLNRINSLINDTGSSIYAAAARLRNHIGTVDVAVNTLKNAIATGDGILIKNANSTFKASVKTMQRYSSPITILQALRS